MVKKKASKNRPHVTLLVLLVVLLIGSVVMFTPPNEKIKQGLDVQGGLSVVMEASKPDASAVSAAEMQTAANIVERRINLLGASEATVQIQGDRQLLVQIPGVVDQAQALSTIGSTGRLEFVDVAKITDNNVQTALSLDSYVTRDQLVLSGDLSALDRGTVNAKLFVQGSSGLLSSQSDSSEEEQAQVYFPDSMTKNPLDSTRSSPTAPPTGSGYTPMRLGAGTYEPIFDGSSITRVVVERQGNSSPYFAVNITLNSTAAAAFGEVTTELYPTQGKIAILLDGYVQSAPNVQSAITNGEVQITGNYTVGQANDLKTILDSGSLPVTLEDVTSQVVGPTLGQDSLRAGILVAIIGLVIVALYLLFFYKGIGLLTAAAIAVFAVLFLGILAVLSYFGLFALSLAGIAGIVLAIGVAADSSILVLERFKEEIRMGRSVQASSVTGVRHAIITSIDADLVTLVSALAIFFIAIGSVKGFGLTLALGVICDIITMLLFKAPLIRLLAPKIIAKHPGFWGIKEDEQVALAHGELKRGVANG